MAISLPESIKIRYQWLAPPHIQHALVAGPTDSGNRFSFLFFSFLWIKFLDEKKSRKKWKRKIIRDKISVCGWSFGKWRLRNLKKKDEIRYFKKIKSTFWFKISQSKWSFFVLQLRRQTLWKGTFFLLRKWRFLITRKSKLNSRLLVMCFHQNVLDMNKKRSAMKILKK